jgi:uncharacterized RDD family membrane protein YckC
MKNTTFSYAGLWGRVLAFALDYLPILLYLALVAALSALVNAVFPDLLPALFGNPVSGQLTAFFLVTLPVTLYFALLESSAWQATWGKRVLRLKVVGANGERLSRVRALGRTALKFIPWELAHTCIWQMGFGSQSVPPAIVAGLTLVWILVGANVASLLISPRRQPLYDRLAGTSVVSIRDGRTPDAAARLRDST